MFDLFRRRDKAMRYILTAVLGIIAISMVLSMVPGFGAPRASSENVLAEVGGDPITTLEVQTLLQNALRSRQVPTEMLPYYVPQFIEQRINEKAMAYEAERLGFRVTDEELAQAIRSLLVSMMPPSQPFDRSLYQRILAQQNLTVEQFEKNVRENLLIVKLQNLALEGVVVPPKELTDEFHRRNDKVKLQYVVFDAATLKPDVTVTPAETQAMYNNLKANYKTPERRSFVALIADEQKMGSSINVSDDELRRAYSTNQDRYRTPERVKARHILISTMDKPSSEVPALEAKANDILNQLKKGADFAELAKKYSDDKGSAVKGGDLDWVTRGQMVKPFEDATFALQPKQLSGIVKTQYGLHIIEALERENARVKPFEEVKGELAAEVKRRDVYERMQNAVEQARADLLKNPANGQAIADKYGLMYVKADHVAAGGSIPELGVNRELEASLQSVRPNEITPVVQLGPNRLGIAELTAIEPPKQAEFAEVQSQIVDTIKQNKIAQAIQQKREEVGRKLKEAGPNLEAAAKAINGEIKTSDFVSVDSNIPEVGSVNVLSEAFAKPVGSVAGPLSVGDKVVVAKVIEKQTADEAKIAPKDREELLNALKRRRALERKDLFEEGIVARLTKDGKIKKYPEAIRRITAARG